MQLRLKIEATNETGQVFSSQEPAAIPQNQSQENPYILEGDLPVILKQIMVMGYMVGCVAGDGDRRLPEMFDPENETITLPNPFYQV